MTDPQDDAPTPTSSGIANIPFPFQGVFSEILTKSVGFGATKRKEKMKRLWFLERDKTGTTTVRHLTKDYLPTGNPKPVDLSKIMGEFFPEPGIYMNKVAPKLHETQRLADEGDEHRSKEEHYSAEYAYKEALGIDEDHIRANFGLGLTYLSMADTKRAEHTFQKIASLESAFGIEHKHLFNEFGINLRKHGMLDECVEYYMKALSLHPEDDHLLFNIARVHFDREDYAKAQEYCLLALQNNPEQREARRLRASIYCKDPSLRDSGIPSLDLTGEAI